MELKVENKEVIIETKQGAITFLDVLGWKGIYYKDPNAISKLMNIINSAKNNKLIKNKRFSNLSIKLFTISDTIIIATNNLKIDNEGEDKRKGIQLLVHAIIAKDIINRGIEQNILIRGATSYGKYSYSNKELIFMGEAIDEAAEWHENTEWCGVILTPKAQMEYDALINNPRGNVKLFNEIKEIWINYKNIPLKSRNINLKYALNWYNGEDINNIINKLKDNGPYSINIASKYLNTIDFIENINFKNIEKETAITTV